MNSPLTLSLKKKEKEKKPQQQKAELLYNRQHEEAACFVAESVNKHTIKVSTDETCGWVGGWVCVRACACVRACRGTGSCCLTVCGLHCCWSLLFSACGVSTLLLNVVGTARRTLFHIGGSRFSSVPLSLLLGEALAAFWGWGCETNTRVIWSSSLNTAYYFESVSDICNTI